MENKLDFLAVGDIVTGAFIKLPDAHVDLHAGQREICMRFGDKLPFDSVVVVPAVGNSPNAAVSAHRLGLNAALATDLGSDGFGKEQMSALTSEGIDTTYVRKHDGLASNYHYVLRFGPERTILVKHTNFPYKMPSLKSAPRWIYLSSLADNSLPYHHEIISYLQTHPETKLAFQPGTFQIKLGVDALKGLYKMTEVFFCNKEEAMLITNTKESDITVLLKNVHNLGPKIPVITDGPNGAYALDGEDVLFCPMYPDPNPPVDRTGAGDSFSSTFISALALGKNIREALEWGPINSMSVVQKIGAQEGLLTREKLEDFLSKKPANYQTKKI